MLPRVTWAQKPKTMSQQGQRLFQLYNLLVIYPTNSVPVPVGPYDGITFEQILYAENFLP